MGWASVMAYKLASSVSQPPFLAIHNSSFLQIKKSLPIKKWQKVCKFIIVQNSKMSLPHIIFDFFCMFVSIPQDFYGISCLFTHST
jgi:hypothetical protein